MTPTILSEIERRPRVTHDANSWDSVQISAAERDALCAVIRGLHEQLLSCYGNPAHVLARHGVELDAPEKDGGA